MNAKEKAALFDGAGQVVIACDPAYRAGQIAGLEWFRPQISGAGSGPGPKGSVLPVLLALLDAKIARLKEAEFFGPLQKLYADPEWMKRYREVEAAEKTEGEAAMDSPRVCDPITLEGRCESTLDVDDKTFGCVYVIGHAGEHHSYIFSWAREASE